MKSKGQSKAKFRDNDKQTNSIWENWISYSGKCTAHSTGEKINATYCSGVCEGRPDMKLRHSSGAEDTWPLSAMLPASDLCKWCSSPIKQSRTPLLNTSYASSSKTLRYRQIYCLQTLGHRESIPYEIYILPFDSWPSCLIA